MALTTVAVLTISLTHLTAGLHELTGDSWTLSILLAIAIDAGILAAEWMMVVASVGRYKGIKPWAILTLVVKMALSAALNSMSFTAGHEPLTWKWWVGVVLGCALPLGVFADGKMIAGALVGARLPEPPTELDALLRDLAAKPKAEVAEKKGISVRHLNRKLAKAKAEAAN